MSETRQSVPRKNQAQGRPATTPAEPAPFICPICGSVNGWLMYHCPATGVHVPIPGCARCRAARLAPIPRAKNP